jgi:hypothetical protein
LVPWAVFRSCPCVCAGFEAFDNIVFCSDKNGAVASEKSTRNLLPRADGIACQRTHLVEKPDTVTREQ